ncbi:MAG: hypothetical protein AAB834_03090 [Patescibacteria group bacterium]
MTHLVVIGFDEIVSNKYMSCIADAISAKAIDGYTVIDLKSQKPFIESRIAKLSLKPEAVYYLPENFSTAAWSNEKDYEKIITNLAKKKSKIKVYIATEVKAHEGYLRFCVENGFDSLVEKPVFAPMSDTGFDSAKIDSTMHAFVQKAAKTNSRQSVMSLSRYHPIYNDIVITRLQSLMEELDAPITSFHLKAAGGVWNLHREFESSDDHPHKYGYGMLMHGAYHYIDLAAQFISLNRLIYSEQPLTMTVSSHGAFPSDQNDRISKKISADFHDNQPNWPAISPSTDIPYGETDIVSSFCIKNMATSKTIMLGTLAFEQTTPSIRNWEKIPEGLYNKKGRTSRVDLEAQLSTLHAVNVECYDVPIKENGQVDRIDAFARVSTRTNAALLSTHEYVTEETHTGIFHSESNKRLMFAWLMGKETKSSLESHMLPMYMIEALAESLKKPGEPVTIGI